MTAPRTPPARNILHIRWIRRPAPVPEWIGYAQWPELSDQEDQERASEGS